MALGPETVEFVERLCAVPVPSIAPGAFETLLGIEGLTVFEHLEQHPPYSVRGTTGALVDPSVAASSADDRALALLSADRATTVFRTASMACAVYEHALDDDEFLLLPRVGGGYYLVPVRSAWCAGQTVASSSSAASPPPAVALDDQVRARVLMSNAVQLGLCWNPAAIHDGEATTLALGWGPTGGVSVVRKRAAEPLSEDDRRAYAHNQACLVSGAQGALIAHPALRAARTKSSKRVDSLRPTAYVRFDADDADDEPGSAARRARI